jgi:hypothetical protein
MTLVLTQETSAQTGTMYCVRQDEAPVKWFSKLEDAEKFFNEVTANPELLKPVKNILKSEEIDLSLDN